MPALSNRIHAFLGLLLLAATASLPTRAASLTPVDPQLAPDLFVWTDTCNVYVLRDGDAALLIDLGDGSVLDHLETIGVKRVEWVLFTHHHREQCQGAPRLAGAGAKFAAPEAERALFERPTDFRKMNVRLGDAFTIHGTSYVRPPIQPIRLDRALGTNDAFAWRGREFRCVDTRGNSPGSLTYLLDAGDARLAFSGDVMLDGAKMHTWFDTEWDYGFAAGIRALRGSVARLTDLKPALLLPSHGPPVRQPESQLRQYAEKLATLERLYVRGYDVEGGAAGYQDKVSTPTVVSNLWQVTPSVFKFKRPNFFGNFALILAPSGRALVVDCGLVSEQMLDDALQGLREHFGLKAIDAIIVTHMHGDHFLEAPYLREKWGAPIWALDNMVDTMEHPEWFDYAAPIQAYGKKNPDGSPMTGVRVDRAFRPGETFAWEGHRFTVDWMPGQTEFALCLHAVIDGRKIAFTGDNIFGDPDNPAQTGHEAVVAHNSAILEEGYIYAGEYLARLQPDIMVGGHSFVMANPAQFIERYRRWGYEMRDAFRALSPDEDYRYGFDPFWVRAEPYRVALRAGGTTGLKVWVRNFRPIRQAHRVEFHAPPGLRVEPPVFEGELAGEFRRAFPIRVTALPGARGGTHLVGMDITLDGRRYGQWFDFIVGITERPDTLAADSPVKFPERGALPARFPPDLSVADEPAERDYFIFSSPCRSLAQIAAIRSEMPPGWFTPPAPDWTWLQRTRRILTGGGDLRVLALGDSIVNDTMRSGWVGLLGEAYPRARIEATVYVRGGGGCQHYREADRVARYILPRRPDLVLIGGISQEDIASIRSVIRQIRAALPETEFLLMTGAFGRVDARDAEAVAEAPHSGTGAYGRALQALAAEERCAYLDLTGPWAEYLRSSGGHPHRFYRDSVHANEFGEQILAQILMAFWNAPPVLTGEGGGAHQTDR